jgi:hypothetical protein
MQIFIPKVCVFRYTGQLFEDDCNFEEHNNLIKR